MEHLTPIVFINSFSIVLRFKSINRVVSLNHLLHQKIRVVMEVVAMVGVLPVNVVLNTVGAECLTPIVTNQHLPLLLLEEAHVVTEILATVYALPANAVLNTAGVERPLPTVTTQHLPFIREEEPRVVMEIAAMVGALPANAVLSGDGVVGLLITATKLRRKPMI